jgi:Na+/melibiose symporter-like transporter
MSNGSTNRIVSPSTSSQSRKSVSSSSSTAAKRRAERDKWTTLRYIAYGVGHVLNDMCASTWFSYLLVFLRSVAQMSPVDSAIVMFAGQIADGVATPLVGVLSDKSKGFPSIGFGRRKTWLAGGAVLVIICFFFVFASCLPRWFTDHPSRIVLVFYYSISASLFNFGWAAVQVSHMALVPELSSDNSVRCVLNSTRYAFTILSNVLVFCVFFFLLREEEPYNVPDDIKFSLLAYTTLIVGGAATLFFLVGTKEKITTIKEVQTSKEIIRCSPSMSENQQRGPASLPFDADLSLHEQEQEVEVIHEQMTWKDWFFVGMFYEVGIVYMCTRLVVNVTQVFISFYLIVTLKMSATSIAIVPLLVYVSGFVATFFLRYLNEAFGRTGSFNLGSMLVIISLALSYMLTLETAHWIFFFSVILGMGNSIIMVTSVCLEGDLVGNNIESGAFVYGAMSFTDKVSNGIAILLIQNTRENLQDLPDEDAAFLRQMYCILPAVAAVIGMITVLYMRFVSRTINLEIHAEHDDEEAEELLNHSSNGDYGAA